MQTDRCFISHNLFLWKFSLNLREVSSFNFSSNHESSQGYSVKVFNLEWLARMNVEIQVVASIGKHFSRVVSFSNLILEPFHHSLSHLKKYVALVLRHFTIPHIFILNLVTVLQIYGNLRFTFWWRVIFKKEVFRGR